MKAEAKVNVDGNGTDGYNTEVILSFENGAQSLVLFNPSESFENGFYDVTFTKSEPPTEATTKTKAKK